MQNESVLSGAAAHFAAQSKDAAPTQGQHPSTATRNPSTTLRSAQDRGSPLRPRPELVEGVLALLISLIMLAACSAPTQPAPLPTQVQPPTLAPASTQLPTVALPPTLSATATPEPTATPIPAAHQLITGGCCAQPSWSPDGSQVWFIDKPSDTAPVGIWGVTVTSGASGEPQFITDRPGFYSRDNSLVAYPEDGQTYIERVATGERWIAPSEGRAISFSPDGSQIAWQVNFSSFSFDRRTVEVWVAGSGPDANDARRVATFTGGGLSGWFPGDARLLVTYRESAGADPALAVLNIADGTLTALVQSPTLRGGQISPGGAWVAYGVTFSGDATQDGLWVIRSDGSERRRLDVFGSYRWRTDGELIIVPLEADGQTGSHRFIAVDAATGEIRPLTDPALTPFRIANGDWSLSPDGTRVVFVSAEDRNLWVIELP